MLYKKVISTGVGRGEVAASSKSGVRCRESDVGILLCSISVLK